MVQKSFVKPVMLGHAVGDALGVPVEFAYREKLDLNPVTDMRGYGTFDMPAGCFSDDTSMSLAALESLSEGKLDLVSIMNNFGKWLYEGEFTPTGVTFDVGSTCMAAIDNYFKKRASLDDCGVGDQYANGNGSLMRIHPLVLFEYYCGKHDMKTVIYNVERVSALTHSHKISCMGCGIYAFILFEVMTNPCKQSVFNGLKKAREHYIENPVSAVYSRLFNPAFGWTARNNINSSGYVVDTLEAAVWCVVTTDNYKDCVLKAVNLGRDTDTIAAIAGGIAGALYGLESIPAEWLSALKKRDFIEELCDKAEKNWLK